MAYEAGRAHDVGVLLSRAIREALKAAGELPADLARGLGVSESTVSRLINGETRDVTVARVVEIEDYLEMRPGQLFRLAGLVAPEDDAVTRSRIESDPSLDDIARPLVLQAYDWAVRDTAERRSTSDDVSSATNDTSDRS